VLRRSLHDGDLKAILRRVEAGKLDIGLGIFKRVPGVRRTPFFRFSLILIRAEQEGAPGRATMTWSALNGQPLISLAPDNPTQQLIDQQLAGAGVVCPQDTVVNLLDTQIALVEANEGIAVIPSFGLPVARNRKVTSTQRINPVAHLEFHQISNRAKPLSPDAAEFTAFLKSYISRWAGRSGVL